MRKKSAERLIIATDSILTKMAYILYPAIILYLAVLYVTDKEPEIIPALLVPGISFVLVSLFRAKVNARRPYEMPDGKPPVIKKDTSGKSFPSRHVFSIFMVAVTAWRIWPILGALTGVAGVIMAIMRVKGGVHFPRDVIAGALAGIVMGVVGFWFIYPAVSYLI